MNLEKSQIMNNGTGIREQTLRIIYPRFNHLQVLVFKKSDFSQILIRFTQDLLISMSEGIYWHYQQSFSHLCFSRCLFIYRKCDQLHRDCWGLIFLSAVFHPCLEIIFKIHTQTIQITDASYSVVIIYT